MPFALGQRLQAPSGSWFRDRSGSTTATAPCWRARTTSARRPF